MKKLVFWTVLTAAVMLGLPFLAVTFAGSSGGMAVSMILLLVINPLFALLTGALAWKESKARWILPVLLAAMFLAGAMLFLGKDLSAFLMYAAAYLFLGTAAMLIARLFRKKG